MRILIVEDSQRLRVSLADGLASAGYAVDAVSDGRTALANARAIDYDLMLLDMMLPEMDGLGVLRRLRELRISTPVLILSARDRVEQRIEGLRAGADDYVVKPFDFGELLARIEAVARRRSGVASNVITIRDVSLDLAAKRCAVRGGELTLPPREYAILEYLFLHSGTPVGRAIIEEHIYAGDRQVWSNTVDSAIASLRRRLGDAGVHDLIETRRGMGYMVPKPGSKVEDD